MEESCRYLARLLLIWTALGLGQPATGAEPPNWWPFTYDDSYITKHLDERYAYLKLENGSYMGPRDYFNFSHLHEPTRSHLEGVNLEQHLYEEIKSMEITSSVATMDQWHYTDDEIQGALDGEADEQKCLGGLKFMARQVERADLDGGHLFEPGYRNQQTLKLLDTWGRPPAETYFGNSYWVGSYRGCRLLGRLAAKLGSPKVNSSDDSALDGEHRYCWAKIRAKDWPERDEMTPPTSIRVGICLPASCNTKLANQNRQLIMQIMRFNFSPMHRDRFIKANKLIDVYCLPKKTPNDVSPSGMIFRILVAYWLLLLLSLSVVARIVGKEHFPEALYNLTIQENYRRFAADDEPPALKAANKSQSSPETAEQAATRSIVDLRPIGVARFVTTVLICMAHCVCTFGWVSKSSSFNIMVGREPIYSMTTPLLKSNDIFWIISGLLTSYTILGRFKMHDRRLFRPGTYFGIILARYLRMASMQVLVLAFIKSTYISLGEGPFWDYGTYKYSLQGQCQRSSWWRILLVPILFSAADGNNYKHECLPVSWYTVADMKLSLIVPALVYLLASGSNFRRRLLIVAVALISLAAQYNDLAHQQIIYLVQAFKYSQVVAINMLSMAFSETGYYNVLHRLFPLSVGMLAGICLRERNQNRQHKAWPCWMRGPFFVAIIAYQFYDWFAHFRASQRYLDHGEMPDETTLRWVALLRPRLDCVMLAIMMVRMTSDLAPNIMEHAKSLYKLSKISYCVLLVHPMVISYLVNADESSRMDMFGTQLIRLIVCCVGLSYLISFPLYLLFEAPMASLTGLLFKRKRHSDTKTTPDSSSQVQGQMATKSKTN